MSVVCLRISQSPFSSNILFTVVIGLTKSLGLPWGSTLTSHRLANWLT